MKTRRSARILTLLSMVALGALMTPVADATKKRKANPKRENSPLVIGHRGASGFLPGAASSACSFRQIAHRTPLTTRGVVGNG
jgi:glycerophosphoryl diester phosphodiesterase